MSRPFFFAFLLVFVSGASVAADQWVVFPDGSGVYGRYTRYPSGYFPKSADLKEVFGEHVSISQNPSGPGVRVQTSMSLRPIGSGSPLATVETALLSRGAIKTAGRTLARLSPAVFVGLEIMDYLIDDDITLENGQFVKPGEAALEPVPGATRIVTPSGIPDTFDDPQAACEAATEPSWPGHGAELRSVSFITQTVSGNPPAVAFRFGCNIFYPGYGTFQNAFVDVVTPVCPDGSQPINGQCLVEQKRPATDAEIEAAIDSGYSAQPSPQASMVTAAVAAGVPFIINGDEPATTTLKSGDTVTGTESTTTTTETVNADGSTSTTTTTNTTTHTSRVESISGDGTLGGTQLNVSSTSSTSSSSTTTTRATTTTTTTTPPTTSTTTTPATTTTTTGPGGEISTTTTPETTTTTTTPGTESTTVEDVTFTDPSMPAIPDLYEQKYPEGITGVWAEHWPRLQATAFMTGLASMFPTFGDSGTCPQWGMSLDIGEYMMFGYGDLTVACSLWQIIGLIILTTACFTAWRIIF